VKFLGGMIFLAALVALLFADWSGGKAAAVNVIGSTSIQPFAEMLAQEYNRTHPDAPVDVQGGGSTAGIQAVREGVADIGMCSRLLRPDEVQLFTPTVIARDGLAIVVHPSNPLRGLRRDQIRQLFDGELVNWKQVGGDDRSVRLITREEGSGTREAFQKLIMGHDRITRSALTQESNGAVKELVCSDPAAIGYMSLGLVGKELKILDVDGVPGTYENVIVGKYPLVRPFLFVVKGQARPATREFLDFLLSADAQRMLVHEGLVPAQ